MIAPNTSNAPEARRWHPQRAHALKWLVIAAGTLLGGCSYIIIQVPDARPVTGRLECDAYVVPTVDAAFAAGLGYGLIESGSITQNFGGGFALLAATAIEVASAVHGYRADARCRRLSRESDAEDRAGTDPRPAEPADKLERQRALARDRAWAITQAAEQSARVGDCPTVARLDQEVRELDAEFHATVFARDAGIRRCLTQP